MTRIEKAALSLLILYTAFYQDAGAVWWVKEVCLGCMFVFVIVFFFAGGKKDD